MFKMKLMMHGAKVIVVTMSWLCFRRQWDNILSFVNIVIGVNLRSRSKGIFPSAYVVDVDYADFDPDGNQVKRDRYVLQYLGSVETSVHKGEQVLCAAVQRIRQISSIPQPCFLEISDQGLHVTDKGKQDVMNKQHLINVLFA